MQSQDLAHVVRAPNAGATTTLGCSISRVPGGLSQAQSSDAKFPLGPVLTISSLCGDAAAQDSSPLSCIRIP